jgi:5-methylcytosine-specific restriction endonuclease McrA
MNNIVRAAALLPAVLEAMRGEAERWPVVRTGEREPISRVVRLLVWRRDEGQCRLCSARSSPTELDHIVPWSAGGSDDSTNLRLLCRDCNQARSNFRLGEPVPSLPVVMCCDWCLVRMHHDNPYRCQHWPLCQVCGDPGPETRFAYCGTCREYEIRARTVRLL